MPVHYFPNYPTTKVLVNSCVVVHEGRVFHLPVSSLHPIGDPNGGWYEFGEREFRRVNWTNDQITFKVSTASRMLFIRTPDRGLISLERTRDDGVN